MPTVSSRLAHIGGEPPDAVSRIAAAALRWAEPTEREPLASAALESRRPDAIAAVIAALHLLGSAAMATLADPRTPVEPALRLLRTRQQLLNGVAVARRRTDARLLAYLVECLGSSHDDVPQHAAAALLAVVTANAGRDGRRLMTAETAAQIDAAVTGAMASKFRNMGQTCVCANRFLVQDDVYDEFAEKFAAAASALKIGNGKDDGVQQGPLIDMAAVEKVEDHIGDALAKGARAIVGGERHELGGSFFQPTVLTDVNTQMKIAYEETFGPVAPLFRFSTEEDAIALANDTQYGLCAYFYSRDVGRIWRVAEALEYGIVGINEGIISTEVAPFGGVKESGIGREGAHHGLDEYLEVKYLCMGGIDR